VEEVEEEVETLGVAMRFFDFITARKMRGGDGGSRGGRGRKEWSG